MSRLGNFKYREIIRRLKYFGFVFDRQAAGSHEIWYNPATKFTQGETLGELKENIKDAVKCHFDEKDMPHILRLHTVKDEVMAL